MTFSEDDIPRPARRLFTPPVLDMLGVEELNEYVAALEAEILRVKQAINAKQAHAAAASAFFKPKPDA